jgi:hypothetical protein
MEMMELACTRHPGEKVAQQWHPMIGAGGLESFYRVHKKMQGRGLSAKSPH